MKIDGAGLRACLCGEEGPVLRAIGAALRDNGCAVAMADAPPTDPIPDLLVVQQPLALDASPRPLDLQAVAGAMRRRGAGRIVVVLSALAAVPARRFPDASLAAGVALLAVRTLAMAFGPAVLVNAVGCGVIAADDVLLSGDAAMLGHVPDGTSGTIEDIVHAALFLCDPANSYMTGQMLTVDGGWSTGYGRNF